MVITESATLIQIQAIGVNPGILFTTLASLLINMVIVSDSGIGPNNWLQTLNLTSVTRIP